MNRLKVVSAASMSATGSARNTAKTLSEKKLGRIYISVGSQDLSGGRLYTWRAVLMPADLYRAGRGQDIPLPCASAEDHSAGMKIGRAHV